MAQGRRVERVGALIRREVSELLMSGIKDDRIHSGMVSVTHVEVAGDLQHCRIFVSVLGDEEGKARVLEGLKAAAPYVKGELGRRLRMRRRLRAAPPTGAGGFCEVGAIWAWSVIQDGK